MDHDSLEFTKLRLTERYDQATIEFRARSGQLIDLDKLHESQWATRLFYEDSACVPMLLVGAANDERVGHHRTDDRPVG